MAITTFSQNVAAFFPAGTSLGAYPESNYPAAHRPPTAGVAPLGAATATASVDSTGLVSFTGLADSTVYYLSGSGGTKHLRITTLPSTVTENVGHKDRANGYAGLDANGRVPSADLTPASVNVKDTLYGAKGDGTTDDRAAIQAAITAVAGGGDVFLPAGTYYLNSTGPLSLPKSAGGLRIRGAGRGATTIKLSATVPRAFDLTRTADYDTFQNIEVCDLTVDCNSIVTGTKDHVVIGNLVAGSWSNRLNFASIAVRRVNTINVPTSGDNNGRQNVSIVSKHPASDEATQTSLTDIVVEDCDFAGGMVGVAVMGSTGAGVSANVWLDRIRVSRLRWDSGSLPTAVAAGTASAGIQLGGTGFGNVCAIEGCDLRNAWDVGVEVDSFIRATVSRSYAEDCWNSHFFARNFHVPYAIDGTSARVNAQKAVFRDCHAAIKGLNPAYGGNLSQGFVLSHSSASAAQAYGHIVCEDCSYVSKSPYLTPQFGTGFSAHLAPINRVTLRRCTVTHDQVAELAGGGTGDVANGSPTITNLSSAATWHAGMGITGTGIPANTLVGSVGASSLTLVNSGQAAVNATATNAGVALTGSQVGALVVFDPIVDCVVDIDGLRTVIAGTGQTITTPRHVMLSSGASGKNTAYTRRGFRAEQTLTGLSNGNTIITRLGNGVTGGTYSFQDYDATVASWSGDTNPKPYYFDANTVNNVSGRGVLIHAADHTNIPSTGGTDINGSSSNAPDSTIRPKVRVRDSVFKTTRDGVASVASATTTTLPWSTDYIAVTGTTTITSVTAAWAERIVTLVFAGALTFTDGSNLKLAGDFVTTADDSITLRSDGTNWIEVARSVN